MVKTFSEFFHLPSTLGSEFFLGEGVQTLIFVGHTKFEVKKFSEYFPLLSPLDWIFQRGGLCSNFFGDTKFETKIFKEFFPLPSALDIELFTECPGTNFLWSYQIWGQTFFYLQSALDSEFFFEAGVPGTELFGSSQIWNQTFFGIFCLECFVLWIFQAWSETGSGSGLWIFLGG